MNNLQNPELNEFIYQIPSWEGKGYVREIEVHPDLWLLNYDVEHYNDILEKVPESAHPVQFQVLLSGKCLNGYGGQVGEGYTMISGSGVQRAMLATIPKCRYTSVDNLMEPDVLRTFFPAEDGDISPQLQFLTKGNDWQTLLYLKTTTAIQGVAQQIVNCPYKGMTKRMYLQAKIQELMTLQLAPIMAEQDGLQPYSQLKAQNIARIHYAKDILLSRLKNPPSLIELTQLVGVSESTLQRGFRQLFGTTVFCYLTDKRMERAEQLLRSGSLSVAEVANLLGYAHFGHFCAAFKRRFGITPSECFFGKKLVSG
ncbi:AraC family transcriptional regulator [Nostoc sp. LPT]|uniref:AraC family transcriptional regulator n=1 Tax=Nostoc sp. LPT TaxID=2815387 RepID=UPI001E0D4BF6|nr:AraC family transcriptional regulator [Nostoc sp. LPT]MBN4006335.1 helix-turn-helix transcriptional regulator [Nostoc sp. LPT]